LADKKSKWFYVEVRKSAAETKDLSLSSAYVENGVGPKFIVLSMKVR
jgi:hypothetical protein